MEPRPQKGTFFREKILNNKFVVYTIIIFILSMTIFS
ncbi:hypothetical protein, partial [Priestia megaterium]